MIQLSATTNGYLETLKKRIARVHKVRDGFFYKEMKSLQQQVNTQLAYTIEYQSPLGTYMDAMATFSFGGASTKEHWVPLLESTVRRKEARKWGQLEGDYINPYKHWMATGTVLKYLKQGVPDYVTYMGVFGITSYEGRAFSHAYNSEELYDRELFGMVARLFLSGSVKAQVLERLRKSAIMTLNNWNPSW